MGVFPNAKVRRHQWKRNRGNNHGAGKGDWRNTQRFSGWVNNAVRLVEPSSSGTLVNHFSGGRSRIPNALSWVKIGITSTDGTKAVDGMYCTRFNKGWLPREAVVEAGTSENMS